jgi:type VI secretion system protein ImpL
MLLWILGALAVLAVWATWFFLQIPLWIPIAATAFVVFALVGVVVYRRVRAARAARALEKAIAQQAQEQALAAKPERAAEIQELHRQIQQGIASLKASKLGGDKRGADALYALPWYVMVGPPGAGKTTALRHSGLVFPFLDPQGGGVRGVGGTRNCDWWFTNEAILLDTAGRYTTEADDHDEWIAFLEQLHKYREEKPLNGVIVAISVSELLDATDDQIESVASKVRARIDEMQSTLKMVLPVYVVFTKVDLIAGFTEFFGDLKKSERTQAWGATLRLDQDKKEPGKIFDTEFDLLVKSLHMRGIKRMALERNRENKEKIYQFPLEFAAVKRNLSDFLAAAFKPEGTSGQPILRGFYFSSGTQEGRPLDRVVGAMGRAFGLRGAATEEPAQKPESKSYFLRDVFTGVVFPDQDLASRSEGEIRRKRIQRFAVAAAAAFVALLFLIPAIIAFGNNRALVAKTEQVSNEAKDVPWNNPSVSPIDKVDKLDHLRDHVLLLDQYEQDKPLSYGFFMYQGDKLSKPAREQYIASLREGFILPTKAALEEKLRRASGINYVDDYNALKAYLLLNDALHLNEPGVDKDPNTRWEATKLTQQWADVLRQTDTTVSEQDLRSKLASHVVAYVDLLSRKRVDGEPLDKALIERVRDILTRVGNSQRFYAQFVTALKDQVYDERVGPTPENLKYPPVTLQELFRDRTEVLTKVTSSQYEREKKWFQVEGPYTKKGHETVLASLDEGVKALEREQWVVPLSNDEREHGDRIQRELDRVRQDYLDQYQRQWYSFFKDIQVAIPDTNRDAINEFKILSTPDWPYQRLLRVLGDNTQFEDKNAALAAAAEDGGVLDQIRSRVTQRINSRTNGIDIGRVIGSGGDAAKYDPVPDRFRSMVEFGVPPPQKGGKDAPPPAPVQLATYVKQLESLSGEMRNIEDGPINADTKKATEKFEEAVKVAQGLLLKMDETGQELMTPLLMNPLRQAYRAIMKHAGGAASGLWEVMVWPSYRDNIKDRYPFNLAATRDATFKDTIAFFKPKEGVLWGFYDKYLASMHTKQAHDFIPDRHMEDSNAPAGKPFTPFNANLYNCLHRADEITEALWGEGGDKPQVSFQINLKTVSPIVSEVIFDIDGQKRLYRNEKELWQSFKWPGEKPTGARIQVRGAGGLDEEITREGPWGIFRLFENAVSTAEKDNDRIFTITWQMTAPPVTVVMEVRPTNANHPFPMSFFRGTNCPPSIGDKFGKGKG